MPWIKSDTDEYVLSKSSTKFHKCSDLSLEELNDPERDFSIYEHNYFIQEYIRKEGNEKLPLGIYNVTGANGRGQHTKAQKFKPAQDLNLFELDVISEVLQDFENFIQSKEIFNKKGLLYKQGILLYGPPGTGKSTCINVLLEKFKKYKPVVFFMDNVPCDKLMQEFKEEKRLKILIFEELVHIVDKESLGEFLTFLDGQHSPSNCYIIASTNYPEKLPGNLVDRPGRFDTLFKIGYLKKKDRETYLKHFLDREPTKEEVELTEGLSIAAIKNILVKILLGRNIKDLIEEHQTRKSLIVNHFEKAVDETNLDDYIL